MDEKMKIPIELANCSPSYAADALADRGGRFAVEALVGFAVETEESSAYSIGMDTSVLVALITSSSALAVAVINSITLLVSQKVKNAQSEIEVVFDDKTTIRFRSNATKEQISKAIMGVKTAQNIKK